MTKGAFGTRELSQTGSVFLDFVVAVQEDSTATPDQEEWQSQ
jgi:hypothetical protein